MPRKVTLTDTDVPRRTIRREEIVASMLDCAAALRYHAQSCRIYAKQLLTPDPPRPKEMSQHVACDGRQFENAARSIMNLLALFEIADAPAENEPGDNEPTHTPVELVVGPGSARGSV